MFIILNMDLTVSSDCSGSIMGYDTKVWKGPVANLELGGYQQKQIGWPPQLSRPLVYNPDMAIQKYTIVTIVMRIKSSS